MTEQMNIFELEPYEENWMLINASTRILNDKKFSHVIPLGTSSRGHGAYRAIFEDKPCTVQIDTDGYIIVKHDDSRFWDVIGGV